MSRRPLLDSEAGSGGKTASTSTDTETALATPKAQRHPISSPSSAPAETPATVPMETPDKMRALALAASAPDFSRGPREPPMVQNPPTARPSRMKAKLPEKATATLRDDVACPD